MAKAGTDPEDKSGLINLNRSRTIYNYVVGRLGLAQAASIRMNSDWRELGIKVCLYDDLRERIHSTNRIRLCSSTKNARRKRGNPCKWRSGMGI